MNSDIYLATVDLILPSLIANACAQSERLSLQMNTERPEEPSFIIDLLKFKRFSKGKGVDSNTRAEVRNSLTLFCREAIHSIRYLESHVEPKLAVYLRSGSVWFPSSRKTLDGVEVRDALAVGSKYYLASNLGLRSFNALYSQKESANA